MSASSDWKRNLDQLLMGAETAVRNPYSSVSPQYIGAPQEQPRGTFRDREDLNNHGGGGVMRELKVCLREIAQLRAELTAEKECRSSLLTSLAKRLKDDLMIDMSAMRHTFQRELKESELKWRQTLDNWEQSRVFESKRGEDILKALKTHERAVADTVDEIKEEMSEMSGKVTSAMASLQQSKLENARGLEQEKASLQHKLDIEMQRYAELHRQQVNMITDMKTVVAKEVAVVSKTVNEMVQQVWDARWGAVSRTIQERLDTFKQGQDISTTMINDLSTKVNANYAEYKAEVGMTTRDIKDRIGQLEVNLPVVSGKIERVEKRLDATGEIVHQVTSTMDNVRAM
eukprot:PhF_6_TR12633/c0_g1_i2/m.20009